MLTPPLVPELIAELACAAPSREYFERELFEQLQRHIGFDVGFFVDRVGLGPVTPGLDPRVLERAQPHWEQMAGEVEELVHAGRRQHGVVIDSEVLGPRLRRTTYFDVFMRPHAGHCTLFGVLSPRRVVVGELVLGRAGSSRAYQPRDAQRLRRLLPTLSLAAASFGTHDSSVAACGSQPAALRLLTPREREVLDYLSLGYTNAQIAAALGSKERTVRNQLSSAYEKLGVGSRAEAVGLLAALR